MIYLDNAATSFPKPAGVVEAVAHFMTHVGANPGRSGHRLSAEAARVVYDARQALAELLGVGDSRRVVFTGNATEALNLAIRGLVRPGDHVVTTSVEHNAVVRPLWRLVERDGVTVTTVPADAEGRTDPAAFARAVTPGTRLVIVNHASNVVGTLAPLARLREALGPHVPLLVDAAQSAGAVPIDVEALGIDLLAFTGHKGLLGPQGTGGLYVRAGLEEEIEPLVAGGTGSRSESEELPEVLPDRFESGTLNAAGLAGLAVSVRYLLERGVADVQRHERELFVRLWGGLRAIDGITLYGPAEPDERVPVVSITVSGLRPSEVGYLLDRRYGIMTRVGLHCAPQAHRSLDTFPDGTVRLALGALSTADEVDETVTALREIAREARR